MEINEYLVEDLKRLRNELVPRAFYGAGDEPLAANGTVKNSDLAEVVFKINSCLGQGYPRRKEEK